MTYTIQSRSLPVINAPSVINTEYLPVLPVNTGNPEEDKINDSVISIYYSLSKLYTKLQKLNTILIQQKHKVKGEKK